MTPGAHARSVPPRSVWVGAAGTSAGFALVRSARDRWGRGARVVAADINPAHLVAASLEADAYVQLPPVRDPDFAGRLCAALRDAAIAHYMPILDEEILLAAELRDAGRLPEGVHAAAPSTGTANTCLDKLAMGRWLDARGFPTPVTRAVADAEWSERGLLAKPRRGRGSVGVVRVADARALDALRAADASDEAMVVQEFCAPPEVTIDAFRGRRGAAFAAVCRERLEVKTGVCTKARVFEDAALADLARAVGEGLDLRGTYCIQVMSHADGGWRITDVNPRPGAGTRMSAAAGVDFYAATLADFWGEDPMPFLGPLPRACHVVRQYTEFVLP